MNKVSTKVSKASKGIRAIESLLMLVSSDSSTPQKKQASKRLLKYSLDVLLK